MRVDHVLSVRIFADIRLLVPANGETQQLVLSHIVKLCSATYGASFNNTTELAMWAKDAYLVHRNLLHRETHSDVTLARSYGP